MLRSAKADPAFGDRECNNRTLRRYFDQAGAKQYSELAASYPDLGGISKYLGDGKNLQALGVMGELSSMVQDLFQGLFAGRATSPSGSSSARRAAGCSTSNTTWRWARPWPPSIPC